MKTQTKSLHDITIYDHDNGNETVHQSDFSIDTQLTSVYFKNIEQHLLCHIQEADYIVGCVAWLTSFPILHALQQKKGVSIIVQKEDFLRPESGSTSWHYDLRKAYADIPMPIERFNMNIGKVSGLSYACDPSFDAIRCVGNHNSEKNPSHPRSHHKFIVFCKAIILTAEDYNGKQYQYDELTPYAVWTGSFNFTKTATQSFENTLVLRDRAIVDAYVNEWGQIFSLSEPLNWETPWAAPEWRLGT